MKLVEIYSMSQGLPWMLRIDIFSEYVWRFTVSNYQKPFKDNLNILPSVCLLNGYQGSRDKGDQPWVVGTTWPGPWYQIIRFPHSQNNNQNTADPARPYLASPTLVSKWKIRLIRLILFALTIIYYIKSRIRETKNLSSDADSRTDTILKRFPDLSIFFFF